MKSSGKAQAAGMRQCAYCGKYATLAHAECPHCHETFPLIHKPPRSVPVRHGQIRRGLLYMLLAGIIHYIAGGSSGLELPLAISPVVTVYLTPLLFFGGLGFVLFGFYLRVGR